ncbi:unnamed protein product [Coregonus sp. 'balchen']|nr:unnamed protein product [Coregonus sp. 'balchen']
MIQHQICINRTLSHNQLQATLIWLPGNQSCISRGHGDNEIKNIVEDLPDPSKDAVKFAAEIRVLAEQYQSSAAEIALICKKKLRLRWADVEGDIDSNQLWAENGLYQDQLVAMLGRIGALYPTKTDWTTIRECTMKKDESLEANRRRLETCFRLHSGIRTNELAYGDLLKDTLAMKKPPMSSETVKTVGASGLPFKEHVTMPLPVSFCEEKYQHQFLYSDHCPVNLMGIFMSEAGLHCTSRFSPLTRDLRTNGCLTV